MISLKKLRLQKSIKSNILIVENAKKRNTVRLQTELKTLFIV